ncbi:hypothetical protein BTO16_15405 [Polaribacter glomeratus]|uniref:Uncharacterized protein n=1 Tax=Polaribacter glomeratus TaxID=102 RepID=A0A2S7WHY9_9FLAO|nr:hypothetical protein BTO16_15405 [Polaribacter glomeratus]
MLEDFYGYFEYASLIISLLFFTKYKEYQFYKYFVFYLVAIVVFENLASQKIPKDDWFEFFNDGFKILNVFTFFEFNLVALIYYNLVKEKVSKNILFYLAFFFNLIYFLSFYFIKLQNYTVVIEGIVNTVLVILYFRELLNSDKILNYKKLLPFWVSVGFLLFYLTSIPFFTLVYSDLFNSRIMFPILYSLIIVFHLCFIYGLVTCKKTED